MPIRAATSSGRERAEVGAALLLAARDVGEQPVPAADHLADRGRDLRVGPAGGDHLLEDPDVAGREVGVEEVAGELPADPERFGRVEHLALALQQALVLGREDRQDELLLRAEVVVDLAERDVGGLGDAARREVGVAVGEQARPRRGEDRARGCRRSPARAARRASGGRGAVPSTMRRAYDALGSRGDRVDGGEDEHDAERPGEPAAPGQVLLDGGEGAEREHRASGCRGRRRTSRASATSSSRRRTRRGRCPSRTPRAARTAAPAVHDEAERAAALVEAAVPQRAELPQAGGEQGRRQDELRVRGQPRQRVDRRVDRRGRASQAAEPERRPRRAR